MTNAVAYLRRSTDRQEQSIDDQRRHIHAYAAAHGFAVVEEFLDDALSGTTTKDRPAFQRMIQAAQSPVRRFHAILVYDVKRFSRGDNDETGHIRHVLRQHGVQVIYTSERLSGTESDELLLPVLQFTARREAQDLSKVTIRGLLSRVDGGSWMGGVPPYGFDLMYFDSRNEPLMQVHYHHTGSKVVFTPAGEKLREVAREDAILTSKRDRCRLVPGDREEVQIVQRIFREFVEAGHGYKRIASRLNHDGIPAPRKGRWARTPQRHWAQTSIRHILRNRCYAGDFVWNRRTEGKFHRIAGGHAVRRCARRAVDANPVDDWIIRPNVHPPLVDRDLFDQAQRIINRRRRPTRPAGRAVTSPYLLSGLVVCLRCQSRIHGRSAMSGRKSNGKRCTTWSYVCGGYVRGGNRVCPSAAVPQDALEQAVTGELAHRVRRLLQPAFIKQVQARVRAMLEEQSQGLPHQLEEVRQNMEKNKQRVSLLVRSVSPDNVPLLDAALTEIRRENERLEATETELEQRLARECPHRASPEALLASLPEQATRFDRLFAQGTLDERRIFVRQFLHRVEIDPVTRCGTAFWYRYEDIALSTHQGRLFGLIGATGFEPATS